MMIRSKPRPVNSPPAPAVAAGEVLPVAADSPPAAAVAAAEVPAVADAPVATPAPPAPKAGRPAVIAGSILLPLGLVALGAVAVVGSNYQQARGYHNVLQSNITTQCSADLMQMQQLATKVARQERTMLAFGLTGAALLAAGTALLVHGTRQARRTQVALGLGRQQFGLQLTTRF